MTCDQQGWTSVRVSAADQPLQSCLFPRASPAAAGIMPTVAATSGAEPSVSVLWSKRTVPAHASGSGPRLAQAASGGAAYYAAGAREGAGAAGRRFKRENKNRPAEASSRQRPKWLQEVVEGTKRCGFPYLASR